MPFVWRKITLRRWFQEEVPWLKKGEILADPLPDLDTTKGTMSVYLVSDAKSNLGRIAAAYAAKRNYPSNLDYALFDIQIVQQLEIIIEETLGDTLDEGVNAAHLDLKEISASKAVELAQAILHRAEEIERISEKDVKQLLVDSIRSGQLSWEKLKESNKSISDRIEPLLR